MKEIRRIISVAVIISLVFGILPVMAQLPTDTAVSEINQVNVGVDLNGTENRAYLRHNTFENWVIEECYSAVYEAQGLKFILSNETGDGVLETGADKSLYIEDDNSPLLTLDGVKLSKAFKGGIIKLQIEGLPEGTHTFTSWHSYFYLSSASGRSTMTVNINGNDVAAEVDVPCKVTDDDDAAVIYAEFEAKANEPVVIYFKADGNSSRYDTPVLNAFEIDGVHPLKDIDNPQPEDGNMHFEPEEGLSWTAAEGAVGHRIYIGEDKYLVETATVKSPEYKGEISATTFDLGACDWDHMKSYYWRVDEVLADGEVVTGRVNSFKVAHLAFPTAEGYGRYANGGRGGRILEVTTLEDGYVPVVDEQGNPILDAFGKEIKTPIEGSLRWAIESFTGPRIVVFRVGGVINLVDKLVIDSEHGDIYIAGQTATGDGITLNNYSFGAAGANDIVIRNIRVRIGDSSGTAMGGMSLVGCDNSIIDHCSISWATDEGFSSRNSSNITLQRSILAEGLYNTFHYTFELANSRRAYGGSIGGNIGSYHHNLLINNSGRNWNMAGSIESDGKKYSGYLDIRNNVIYNWKDETTVGGARRVQFVGNYYKMGAASEDKNIFSINGNELNLVNEWQMAYLSGNKMTDTENNVLLDPIMDDPWKNATVLNAGNYMADPLDAISTEPFFESFIADESADEAYESVLADVGASVPEPDYIDTRYIEEVSEGKYTFTGSKDGLAGIIDSQEDAEGYPDEETFNGGKAPADTDHDGMPDEWEIKHCLNPEDSSDSSIITLSAEGYTNIEMYLNELMGDPLEWADGSNVCLTPTPTETDFQMGDVNADGFINAVDALAVLKHAAKMELFNHEVINRADMTGEGAINAEDALAILKIAAKITGERW